MDIRILKTSEFRKVLKLAPNNCVRRFKEYLKICLFHSSFTFLVLLYVVMGAAILAMIEKAPELNKRQQKLTRILNARRAVGDRLVATCHDRGSAAITKDEVADELRPLLKHLSFLHEYDERFSVERQKWTSDKEEIGPMWTFYASVLYALTSLTATGYDRLSPQTDAGRIFAVAFGVGGIPLMFITAANVGRFLSTLVTGCSARASRFYHRRILAKIHRPCRSRSRSPRRFSIPPAAAATLDRLRSVRRSISGLWTMASIDGEEDDENGNGSNAQSPRSPPADGGGSKDSNDHHHHDQNHEVSGIVVIGLIVGYCSLGSFIFKSFEDGPLWSFLYGFCFSFHTITTITLGDIRVDNALYLGLVVTYCIVGLAVITMCVDLVSVRLKALFTKVHYFGRRLALLKARARQKADDDRKMQRMLYDAQVVAEVLKQVRESAPRASDAGSASRKSGGNGDGEDDDEIETFTPGNIEAIPWVDSEQEAAAASSTAAAMSIHALAAGHM